MAKDDYHVIVYQILSYLYRQLKSCEPVDEQMLSTEALIEGPVGQKPAGPFLMPKM